MLFSLRNAGGGISVLLLLLVLLSLSLASASTISPPAALPLSRRGLPGAVYTCTGPRFTGSCQWTAPTPACHINGGIRSIGPDQSGFCMTFSGPSCNGQWLRYLTYPGNEAPLEGFGSFRCWKR